MTTNALERPIFIVGAARSGTTLLRTLLSAHSRIAIAPETHFLVELAAHVGERGGTTDLADFWDRHARSIRFRDQGVEEQACRRYMAGGPVTGRAMFSALLLAYRERLGKPRVGEKTPGHVRHLSTMLEWYPDSSILVLQRDPRAVVASRLRSPWVKKKINRASLRHGLLVGSRVQQVVTQASAWSEIHQDILPSYSAHPRVLTVPYESLVAAPETALRRICAFLGEEYEQGMISDRTNEAVPAPAGTPRIKDDRWRTWREAHHRRSLAPVSTACMERWREDLAPWEVALVEAQCGAAFSGMGYSPSAGPAVRRLARVLAPLIMALVGAEASIRRPAKAIVERLRNRLPRRG